MWKEFLNTKLYDYITTEIMPKYKLNGKSHNEEHVKDVLKRAFEISKLYENIDMNMLFTAVSYHDIGDHIDRKNHEIVSAQILMDDIEIARFFTNDQKEIIKQAIEDHRASKKETPRSIYGKILASADKNIDVDNYFIRSCEFNLEHYPEFTKQQNLNRMYEHAIEKFGKDGYAANKYYVSDGKYEKYLEDIQNLIDNKEKFYKKAEETFNQILKSKKISD